MVKKILDQWEIATHPTAIQGLACFGWINSFWAEVWRWTLNSHISIDLLSEISLQVLWTYKVFIQKMLKITSWVDSEKIHVPERRQRVPRAIIDVDGDTSPNRPAIKPLHRQTPWLFFSWLFSWGWSARQNLRRLDRAATKKAQAWIFWKFLCFKSVITAVY